jgi:hypothetical protein
MLNLILQRLNLTGPYGAFGVFQRVTDAGLLPLCFTLEPSWNDNAEGKSCIPAGVYICKRVNSPKFGDTFEITNVKDRSHILIHPLNEVEETQGCIGVGLSVSGNHPSLYQSKVAFDFVMGLLEDFSEFNLEIKNPV